MRLPPVEPDIQGPVRPMLEPEAKAVTICPLCRHKLRRTAEICPQCHAERRYGPTRTETIVCTALGLVAVPILALQLVRPSLWLIGTVFLGGLLGFFLAHIRFSGDRWVKAASVRQQGDAHSR